MPGPRLPAVAGDIGTWGTVLNAYLAAANPVFNVKLDPYGAVGDGVADDTAEIQAAIDACSVAGGGIVFFPAGTYLFTTLSLASDSNIRLVGSGTQGTLLISSTTTGNLFDFTGASFCSVEDLSFRATLERTAGAVFYLDAGAGSCQRNEFRRLRIHGGWRAWHLDDCTTTTIDEVQFTDFDASHDWHSMFHLGGTTTSTIISNIRGGSAATVSNAFLYITGALVDTAMFRNWDIVAQSPSTGMICARIDTGSWLYFTDCSLEAGTTQDCVVFGGGSTAHGVSLTACHIQGQDGLEINNGTSVRMVGGEVLACHRHGIKIHGGTHHEIIGVTISDCSQETTNTYDGINVAAGVTDFTITGCHVGKMLIGAANVMASAIIVSAGASDRYAITGNRVATTGATAFVVDGGTGTDKIVKDNIWAGSTVATVASAAALAVPANVEIVNVTGTTTVTSMTGGYKGRRVKLIFAGILTFTDGSNLKLAGNFVTSADDSIVLTYDGTNWNEDSRSVN